MGGYRVIGTSVGLGFQGKDKGWATKPSAGRPIGPGSAISPAINHVLISCIALALDSVAKSFTGAVAQGTPKWGQSLCGGHVNRDCIYGLTESIDY